MCISSPFAFASLATASYSRAVSRSKPTWSINPNHSYFMDARASGLVNISFRPTGLDTNASKNRTTFTAFSLCCHTRHRWVLFGVTFLTYCRQFPETTSADSSHSYPVKSVGVSSVGSDPDTSSASSSWRAMTEATAFVQFGVGRVRSSDMNFQAYITTRHPYSFSS